MATKFIKHGLLAVALLGLGGGTSWADPPVPLDPAASPNWVSPWQPVPITDPCLPVSETGPQLTIQIPLPVASKDAAAASAVHLTMPASPWYTNWSPQLTLPGDFVTGAEEEPVATATPSALAVATAPVETKGPPSMRFIVPSMLRSLGTTVPDLPLALPDMPVPASAMTLDELLGVIRGKHPEAQVVAGFYDWRSTSIYRHTAGLHLGYDIAMPAGTVVPTGWAGKVVAITNWVGPEFGITVETNGFQTTYGHLSPLVKQGDTVLPGQPVGSIVHDHVDVKMRNAGGDYVDFGAHQTSEPVALMPPPLYSGNPREMGVLKFLVAQETQYQAQDRLKHEAASASEMRLGLRDTEATARDLSVQLPKMKGYFDQGLIAKLDLDTQQKKWEDAEGRLHETRTAARQAEERLSMAQKELIVANQMMADARAANNKLGITSTDVTAFVSKYVDKHPSVLKDAEKARTTETTSGPPEATPELAKEKQRLEMLERLYQDGAVALREVEAARSHYATLEAQQQHP